MKVVAALRNQFGGHAVTKVAKGEVEPPAWALSCRVVRLAHLSLRDFRSYAEVELPLDAGVTALVGSVC